MYISKYLYDVYSLAFATECFLVSENIKHTRTLDVTKTEM